MHYELSRSSYIVKIICPGKNEIFNYVTSKQRVTVGSSREDDICINLDIVSSKHFDVDLEKRVIETITGEIIYNGILIKKNTSFNFAEESIFNIEDLVISFDKSNKFQKFDIIDNLMVQRYTQVNKNLIKYELIKNNGNINTDCLKMYNPIASKYNLRNHPYKEIFSEQIYSEDSEIFHCYDNNDLEDLFSEEESHVDNIDDDDSTKTLSISNENENINIKDSLKFVFTSEFREVENQNNYSNEMNHNLNDLNMWIKLEDKEDTNLIYNKNVNSMKSELNYEPIDLKGTMKPINLKNDSINILQDESYLTILKENQASINSAYDLGIGEIYKLNSISNPMGKTNVVKDKKGPSKIDQFIGISNAERLNPEKMSKKVKKLITENIQKGDAALNKIDDTSLVKKESEDLFEIAIKRQALNGAYNELNTIIQEKEGNTDPVVLESIDNFIKEETIQTDMNRLECLYEETTINNKMLTAQINSIDTFSNTLCNNLNENIKEVVTEMVKDIVDDEINEKIESCLRSSRISNTITEQVADKIVYDNAVNLNVKKGQMDEVKTSCISNKPEYHKNSICDSTSRSEDISGDALKERYSTDNIPSRRKDSSEMSVEETEKRNEKLEKENQATDSRHVEDLNEQEKSKEGTIDENDKDSTSKTNEKNLKSHSDEDLNELEKSKESTIDENVKNSTSKTSNPDEKHSKRIKIQEDEFNNEKIENNKSEISNIDLSKENKPEKILKKTSTEDKKPKEIPERPKRKAAMIPKARMENSSESSSSVSRKKAKKVSSSNSTKAIGKSKMENHEDTVAKEQQPNALKKRGRPSKESKK